MITSNQSCVQICVYSSLCSFWCHRGKVCHTYVWGGYVYWPGKMISSGMLTLLMKLKCNVKSSANLAWVKLSEITFFNSVMFQFLRTSSMFYMRVPKLLQWANPDQTLQWLITPCYMHGIKKSFHTLPK